MIDKPAGAELDHMIATVAMGWTGVRFDPGSPACQSDDAEHPHWWGICPDHGQQKVPPYSANIADAWDVVEQFRKKRIPIIVWNTHTGFHAAIWQSFDGHPYWADTYIDGSLRHQATADTAPLAICRCALAAAGDEHLQQWMRE